MRKQRIALLFEEIIANGKLDLADELFAEDFYWPHALGRSRSPVHRVSIPAIPCPA